MKVANPNNSPTGAPSNGPSGQTTPVPQSSATPQPGANQGPAPPNTTIGHYIIGKSGSNLILNRQGARKGDVWIGEASHSHPYR